jgi:hypothetical protein
LLRFVLSIERNDQSFIGMLAREDVSLIIVEKIYQPSGSHSLMLAAQTNP